MEYKQKKIPIYTKHQLEALEAENVQLREQVQEQADALVELAEMLAGEEEENG